MRINNNMQAMNTNRQLGSVQANQAKSMEKLSSGYRINRAGDDAAGLAISEKMRGQISGLGQASRNAEDGISLIQTAEGALNETQNILQRMRELSVQSANDTNVDADRAEIQKEVDQLATEITRISTDTEFNTKTLLNGDLSTDADALTFQIGANKDQNVDLKIADMGAETLGVTKGAVTGVTAVTEADAALTLEGVTLDAVNSGAAGNAVSIEFVNPVGTETLGVAVSGNTITVTLADSDGSTVTSTVDDVVAAINANVDASALVTASGTGTSALTGTAPAAGATSLTGGLDEVTGVTAAAADATKGIDVSTQDAANSAIETINNAITSVSGERSKLGSVQNRLEYTISNLDTSAENLQAAESRIRDVDMATEMMEFTKNNILSSAATSMLAQANQAPQSVLQLLQ